ncbi:hypothetical protein [Pelagibacterium lacus]|uniref:Uncharacterized protein n=1 Tax=Pelagibacterium lacus TaxID=2282655 RepID=A0A369W4K3_9HYPH|nr:hypothetical protein [Pelagibacterium lacus]RDE08937.1 hypothetical protein DVH29_09310 [Pelagibacterium lacus]
MKLLIVSAAALFASVTSGFGVNAADLAAQLDVVASAVNAEDLDAIGSPDDPAEIIGDLDGRWFILNNVVRNWGTEGVGFGPEDLERSQTRNCSDGADSTFYRVSTAG